MANPLLVTLGARVFFWEVVVEGNQGAQSFTLDHANGKHKHNTAMVF